MNTQDSVFNEIIEILADVAECDVQDIKPDTNLPDELGINSLMGLEILVSLERKFKVKISESQLVSMTTPKAIYDMISRVLATEAVA